MNGQRTRALYVASAVAGGLAIALLSVLALAALNRNVVVEQEPPSAIRTISLDGGDGRDRGAGSGADDSAARAAPAGQEEVMTVDLDAPAFDALDGPADAALDLGPAMPLPSVDAIRVFVGNPGVVSPSASNASASVSPGVPGGSGQGTATGRGGSGGTGAGEGNRGGGNGTGSGQGIGDADRVDQPPREAYGITKPPYPARERELGVEGTVVMRILINEQGRVEDTKFISGPEAFRQAVQGVVHTWRFEPARHQGKVVKVWSVKEVKFTHPRNRR